MQAFELYFNPKKRDDIFLTSFVYTPANIYEKRLGNLCVVGELAQALPQNSHFLTNLSSAIKKEYYASGLKKSCEASLQEALKRGNEFLEQESRNGNVGWLGNLSLGVISFKDSVLNFAKAGDIKIFLSRASELVDLSQNLETGLPHPDPLKVFGGMAGGKISAEDKIIVLSKRMQGKKHKFLGELAKASSEKEFRQVMKTYQESLAGVSGICLVLINIGQDESKQTVIIQNDLPNFSLSSNLFKPLIRFFVPPRLKIPKINISKITRPGLPVPPRPPQINFKVVQKKIILVLGLILVLLAFYYIFQGERDQELESARIKLAEAEKKAMLAESLLILQKNDQAKALFEETLDILSPLTKRGSPLKEEALSLQNSIKQFLK